MVTPHVYRRPECSGKMSRIARKCSQATFYMDASCLPSQWYSIKGEKCKFRWFVCEWNVISRVLITSGKDCSTCGTIETNTCNVCCFKNAHLNSADKCCASKCGNHKEQCCINMNRHMYTSYDKGEYFRLNFSNSLLMYKKSNQRKIQRIFLCNLR